MTAALLAACQAARPAAQTATWTGSAAPRTDPLALPASFPGPQESAERGLLSMAAGDSLGGELGWTLRSLEEHPWGVRLLLPVTVAFTDFDFGEGEALDSLTTLSVVPTGEFLFPLGEKWMLRPFFGLGGAWLIDTHHEIAIMTTGLRAEYTQPIGTHTLARVLPRVRYDANLNRPDGLLGDWARVDVAFELRRAFGHGQGRRFQPGIYVQAFWYFDDIDLDDVPGVTPDVTENQLELGVSLGSTTPYKILGIPLPRVFLGYRFNQDLQAFVISFGEL